VCRNSYIMEREILTQVWVRASGNVGLSCLKPLTKHVKVTGLDAHSIILRAQGTCGERRCSWISILKETRP